jgi:hypothetical protein
MDMLIMILQQENFILMLTMIIMGQLRDSLSMLITQMGQMQQF